MKHCDYCGSHVGLLAGVSTCSSCGAPRGDVLNGIVGHEIHVGTGRVVSLQGNVVFHEDATIRGGAGGCSPTTGYRFDWNGTLPVSNGDTVPLSERIERVYGTQQPVTPPRPRSWYRRLLDFVAKALLL